MHYVVHFFPVYSSEETSLSTRSQETEWAARVRVLEERLRTLTNRKEEAGEVDEAQLTKLGAKIQSLRNRLAQAKETIVEQQEKIDRRRRKQIRRTLRFSPMNYQAGLTCLSYFAEIVKHKYPNAPVSVSIIQERHTITLVVETPDGLREKIAKTLKDYEEVL